MSIYNSLILDYKTNYNNISFLSYIKQIILSNKIPQIEDANKDDLTQFYTDEIIKIIEKIENVIDNAILFGVIFMISRNHSL